MNFRDRMRDIWPVLAEKQVNTIRFPYSGSGDSGSFDSPDWDAGEEITDDFASRPMKTLVRHSEWDEASHTWVRKFAEMEMPLVEVLCDLMHDILGTCHSGWEINEGSDGVIILDCVENTITVEHREAVISYNDYSHKFDVSPADLEKVAAAALEVVNASE